MFEQNRDFSKLESQITVIKLKVKPRYYYRIILLYEISHIYYLYRFEVLNVVRTAGFGNSEFR